MDLRSRSPVAARPDRAHHALRRAKFTQLSCARLIIGGLIDENLNFYSVPAAVARRGGGFSALALVAKPPLPPTSPPRRVRPPPVTPPPRKVQKRTRKGLLCRKKHYFLSKILRVISLALLLQPKNFGMTAASHRAPGPPKPRKATNPTNQFILLCLILKAK